MTTRLRRAIIFSGLIVLTMTVSAATAFFLLRQHALDQQKYQGSHPQTSVPQDQSARKTADEAEKLANDGNVTGGIQKLESAIQQASDPHSKFIYYASEATLLLNNNQLDDALVAAKQAYSLEKLPDSAALVGQIARQKGDVATAAEYYRIASTLVDSSDPLAANDKSYYLSLAAEAGRGTQ